MLTFFVANLYRFVRYRFPAHFGSPCHTMPCTVEQRFARVVPRCVHHTLSTHGMSVANKVCYVFHIGINQRKQSAPHTHTGSYPKWVTGLFYRVDMLVKVIGSHITPYYKVHVARQFFYHLWVLCYNVAPHHHSLIVLLQYIVYIIYMQTISIVGTTYSSNMLFGSAGTQAFGFVAIDIKIRRFVSRCHFGKHFFQK